MKVEIESFVCNWADEIPHILIRVINAITLSDNKEVLRTAIKQIAEETELDNFFAYGYGRTHFWLTHRRLSNGEPMKHRLLIADRRGGELGIFYPPKSKNNANNHSKGVSDSVQADGTSAVRSFLSMSNQAGKDKEQRKPMPYLQ